MSRSASPMRFTPEEERELRALVDQAWEIKHAAPAYLTDACEAIVNWNDRRALRELERRMERSAMLVRLFHETTELLARKESSRAA